MPQHRDSCYSSGVDVPEAVFFRRHHRPRMRSETKPGLHGSAGLARRSTKPSLDYMCGASARVFSMVTLIEETSSDDEGVCDFASLAPAAEYACNQESPELEESLSCASSNWEICSEASDVSSFSLLTVATNETDSSWITVGKVAKDLQNKDSDSYAARLLKNGTAFHPCKPRHSHLLPSKEFKPAAPAPCSTHDASDEEFNADAFVRSSWQKKQKGPRSVKARAKITASIARRTEQSHQDRFRATQ
eukprot:TRINITY_DN44372_c0_g1_i1.p1 TRINITY_DN44372_c0_g1~~TRINITY_DN44372_c0_g1_i1.p1  ORF type:complete len:247 (+),score=43.35 TRINITY_DN44372_c0_g1_i1:66-806(+)